MEQHPVPQHIAAFEFKLFGNLTIKQFAKLSVPSSIGILIFFTEVIPTPVRIPLSALFVGIGAFIAFIPIGGRPFEKWLLAFIRAIFAPTQRLWIKDQKVPEFLEEITKTPPQAPPEPITDQGRQRLLNYLRSLPKQNLSSVDLVEQTALESLGLGPTGKIEEGKLPPVIVWPEGDIPYNYRASLPQVQTVATPGGAGFEMAKHHITAAPPADIASGSVSGGQARVSIHAKPYILEGIEKKLSKGPKKTAPKAHLASDTNFALENVIPIQTSDNSITLVHGVGKTRVRKLHFGPPSGFDLSKLPIRGEARYEISEELKKRYHFDESLFAEEPKKQEPQSNLSSLQPAPASTVGIPKKDVIMPKADVNLQKPRGVTLKPKDKEALDSKIQVTDIKTAQAPIPQTLVSKAQIVPLTNTPNVLSGLVADSKGQPVTGAILTLRDASGIPQRALKTNKLGQFLSATPLSDGQYTIEIEAEGLTFRPVNITLKGEVLQALEMKAERGAVNG